MPTFVPVQPPKGDKDCPAWLYEALRRLNRAAQGAAGSTAAILRGEAPDGSGTPLVDNSKYLYKPGISGGQLAYGGTESSDPLTLSSTAATTKGKIYLGSAKVAAFDETNVRLGLGTSSPQAKIHLEDTSDSAGVALLTSTDVANNWAGPYTGAGTPIGGTSASALSSNDGTGSYMAILLGSNGTNPQKNGLNGTVLASRTYTISASVFALSGTFDAIATLQFKLVDSGGNVYAGTAYNLNGISTTPTTITTTITTTSPTASGESANSLQMLGSGDGLYVCVSYVTVTTPGSGALMRWDDITGTQLGGMDSTGKLGIGTGNAALAAMIHAIASADSTPVLRIVSTATQSADLMDAVSNVTGNVTFLIDNKAALQASIKSNSFFVDSTDLTKKLSLVLSNITTATTRTWTIKDYSGIPLVPTTEGTLNQVLKSTGGQPSWVTDTLLDGTIHSDTAAGTVVRGDLIVGNSTPAWARLAMGTAYQLLGTDGTDTKWLTPLILVGQAYSPVTPVPALAPAGDAYIFADSGLNRAFPAFNQQEGRTQWLQPNLGWHQSVLIAPADTLAASSWGATLASTVGTNMTITFPALDLTQVSGARQINMAYTGSLANVQGSIRTTKALVGAGGGAGLGGYHFVARFSPFMDNTTHTLMFVGLMASLAAPGNTDPANMVNMVGIGFNASKANYQIFYNDGSGTATQIDLGSSFAFGAGVTIQFELYCPPNSTTIYYRVIDLAHTSTAPVTGNISSNVPTVSTGLAFHCWINTGTTGTFTPSVNLHRVYIESDI